MVTDDTKLEKRTRKPLFIAAPAMINEEEIVTGYEVHMKKKTITDSKPVHFGCAILQWSKIIFMR